MNFLEIIMNQVTLLSEMKPSDALWLFLIPALSTLELLILLLMFSKPKEKMGRVDMTLSLVVFFVCYAVLFLFAGLWILGTDQKSYAMEKPSLIPAAISTGVAGLLYGNAMEFSQGPNPPTFWPAPCQSLSSKTDIYVLNRQMASGLVTRARKQAESELAASGDTPPGSFDATAKADAYETRVVKKIMELAEKKLSTPQGLAELCAQHAKP